jgi:ubiquinone/menaquinone biosynthesis C-methylase UbiE
MAPSNDDIRHRRLVAERYGADPEAYRDLFGPALRTRAAHLLEALPLSDARRVADVAAGVGLLLPEIKARAPDAYIAAFDLTQEMLALVPVGFPRAVMDASALAVASETLDVAVVTFMLHHVLSPIDVIRETRRVVRSGGFIGTATWGPESSMGSYPALDVLTSELDRRGASAQTTAVTHHLLDTPEKMRGLMQSAGFEPVSIWTTESVNRMTPDLFLERHTRLGVTARRFLSLDAGDRSSVLAVLRARLELLPETAFDEPMNVVYATGRAA